jgi:hypothetical protein
MPFKVVTTITVVHTGPPDDSIFKIFLEDGTTLVGTDRYPHYPAFALALHPDFYPHDVEDLVEEEYQRRITLEHEYVKDVGTSGRDPMELAKTRVDRKKIDAFLGELVVGKSLTITVGKKTITYPQVIILEGSA